jgi:hypothetical protein
MNDRASADWQIRNGAYPITPSALEPIAKRIAAIESFHVHLGWKHANHRNMSPKAGQFDFQRAASGKMTVAKWRETRFRKSYPELTVHVVDPDGRILDEDEMIAVGRGFIIQSSSLILEIRAWIGGGKHNDDETLLKGLGLQLSRFPFMETCSVQRSHLIWKLFPRWELTAFTMPMTLRFYEHQIVERLIRERVVDPGFRYEIQQFAAHPGSSHAPVFLAEHLNKIFAS